MYNKRLIPVVVVLMFVLIWVASLHKKEDAKTIAVTNLFEKSQIIYIGDSEPGFPVIKHKLGDPISEKARFVLIDDKLAIPKEQQSYLQKLINEKRIVLFIGDDIQKKTVSTRIGLTFDDTTADANMDQYYTLFGYGFSFTYQKNMILYLSSNGKGLSALTIQEFLYNQFTKF